MRQMLIMLVLYGFLAGTAQADGVVSAASTRSPAPSMRVLRLGLHVSTMGSLDPHLAAGSQDRAVADMLFNGLLRYRPGEAPRIEPDLAEAIPTFEMIDGRQIWTIHLRQGVLFHPGPKTPAYELTAEDVAFSLGKSADAAFSAYAGEYEGLEVAIVDRYTVRVSLSTPLSPILFLPKLTNYAGGFIVSQRAVKAMGYDAFANHPVGTGPFLFQRYDPGSVLILQTHDGYFRGRPQLDGVQIRFMPDILRREAALRRGELDVIAGSGKKGWLASMEACEGIVVDTFGVGEVATLYFNTRMPPMDDLRVRKAIAYALDRNQFVRAINPRLAGQVFSPVPISLMPGGLSPSECVYLGLDYATDLSRSRQLLSEAGYGDGFSLDLVTSEKRLYRAYYESIKEQLARIGICCQIHIQTHAQMHRTIRQNPQALVVYVAWRPNADTYLSQFFHSDAMIVNGRHPDTNFSRYDKIDRLIEAARVEILPETQVSLWEQAQIRILADMAAYPIMYTNQCYARREGVDYGHPLVAAMALYPQFTEKTRLTLKPCAQHLSFARNPQ